MGHDQPEMPWGDAIVIKRNGEFWKDGVKIGQVVGMQYDEVVAFAPRLPKEAIIKLEVQVEFD